MIEYNGIQTPCFGTLEEIHTALIKDLNWLNEQVSINGQVKQILYLALLHPGTAILTGMKEALWHDPSDSFTVVTSGKVPHVSKRCALCGMQLDQEGVTRGACPSCYAEEVSSWTY